MRSVFMLAVANLRRHKGSGISLGLLVLISAMLLSIGLLSITGLTHNFNQKITELDAPYTSTVLSRAIHPARLNQIKQFIKSYSAVTGTQEETVLYFSAASFPFKTGGNCSNTVVAENVNAAGKMGKLSFVGEKGPQTDTSIYVPYILKAKGYSLGDNLSLTYLSKVYHFTVAGFTEDLLMGNYQTGGIRFFLPDSSYKHFVKQLNDPVTQAVMISARTRSINSASDLYNAINEQVSKYPMETTYVATYGIDISKIADSMPVSIGAAMEIAFAFVVAIVLLLVIRFRIVNSIEEDMQNIGALEAVGYTSRQIRGAFLVQFIFISLLGGLTGIALSYAIAIPHGKMLSAVTGLDWTQGFDLPVSLATLAILLFCVALVAFVSTRRIRALPVIVALRGGIATHSFRKNPLPLERTHGSLNLLLSIKSMLVNARQNIALLIILSAVSFASIFTFMLLYNFAVNNSAVMKIMGGEPADIAIGAKSPGATQSLRKELRKEPAVTQATDYGYATLKADGRSGYGRITSDYSKLKNNQAYEGRYPKHENEAALGGILAAKLHKGVGDSVTVSFSGEKCSFIITGLTQSINDFGEGIYLTTTGMRRVSAKYEPVILYVYTKDGADINAVMHRINKKYSEEISGISNHHANTISTFKTYETVVAMFSVFLFALLGLIVFLILTLITGTMLVGCRRQFGIEKALGFTTWQLMHQVSFGFLPIALLGSLAGGVLGCFCANPLMSCMFRVMGIMKTYFILPAASLPVVCIIIALLTYIIAMLAAFKVHRISPCALINE